MRRTAETKDGAAKLMLQQLQAEDKAEDERANGYKSKRLLQNCATSPFTAAVL